MFLCLFGVQSIRGYRKYAMEKLFGFVLALYLHEFAHGLAGYVCGDRGVDKRRRMMGILPLDSLGTVLSPLILSIVNIPLIGWTSPPHQHPQRYRNPRTGVVTMLVAGVLMNFVVVIVLAGSVTMWRGSFLEVWFLEFLEANVLICALNLIPFPPFDLGLVLHFSYPRLTGLHQKEFEMIVGVIVIVFWYGMLGMIAEQFLRSVLFPKIVPGLSIFQ